MRILGQRKQKLLEACSKGSPTVDEIRRLAKKNPKAAKAKDAFGSLPLHWACRKKPSLEVTTCLVEMWPDAVRAQNKFGFVPLHYACANGARLEVVRYLFEQWPAAYQTASSTYEWLPLKLACAHKAPDEVIRFLIQQRPNTARMLPYYDLFLPGNRHGKGSSPKKCNVGLVNLSYKLVLSILSYLNSVERVKLRTLCRKFLIVTVRETNRIMRRKEHVKNELFQACKQSSCSVEKIRRWVQSHPDSVKLKCKEGWIALHYVCRNKPLLETVRYLVEQCPETVQQVGRDGSIPLHFACCNGAALEVIQYLVHQWNEGIKERDKDGRLPLHYACRFKGPVQLLVDQWPASVRVHDNYGALPLHYACRFKAELKTVQSLVNEWPEGVRAEKGMMVLDLARNPFDSAPLIDVVQWLESVICNVHDDAVRQASEKAAELEMNQSIYGKAFKFVEQVLAVVKQRDNRCKTLQQDFFPVGRDDLFCCAVVMFKKQEELRTERIDSHVDIAYHYTRSRNLRRIRQDGLLTKADRDKMNITTSMNGLAFGDGVYTGNNPFAFTKYGDCGLMVARLKGATIRADRPINTRSMMRIANTVIGNKLARGRGGSPTLDAAIAANDEVVLKSSSQCIALIQYNTSIVTDHGVTDCYAIGAYYHKKLQEIVDHFFNDGETKSQHNPWLTPHLQALARPTGSTHYAPVRARKTHARVAAASISMPPTVGRSKLAVSGTGFSQLKRSLVTVRYVAPETLQPSDISLLITATPVLDTKQSDCSVCLYPMNHGEPSTLATLKACGHTLHKPCLVNALKNSPKCPVCRKAMSEPCGKMPSGSMTITESSVSCQGFDDATGSFVIMYYIPSGTQKDYHDHPGKHHGKALRTAYLPNNANGQALLKRLKYAFLHGLTFTIGHSLTLNRDDCVTWGSIHHKTDPKRGCHGFPDPNYFANCNKDLDALGVPQAVALAAGGRRY